jgi:hypothetical protein
MRFAGWIPGILANEATANSFFLPANSLSNSGALKRLTGRKFCVYGQGRAGIERKIALNLKQRRRHDEIPLDLQDSRDIRSPEPGGSCQNDKID